jgi:hypothetical protein
MHPTQVGGVLIRRCGKVHELMIIDRAGYRRYRCPCGPEDSRTPKASRHFADLVGRYNRGVIPTAAKLRARGQPGGRRAPGGNLGAARSPAGLLLRDRGAGPNTIATSRFRTRMPCGGSGGQRSSERAGSGHSRGYAGSGRWGARAPIGRRPRRRGTWVQTPGS